MIKWSQFKKQANKKIKIEKQDIKQLIALRVKHVKSQEIRM